MTSFCALQLMHHSERAGGACGKKHVELQSRERGWWGAGRKSVCVHMKVKCLHCSGNCGWKMKQCKGGGKDTVTNEWEHCRKKRRESILEIKLPLLQDNLRTLTIWRWAEAERQLRSSEGRRRRRRGGERLHSWAAANAKTARWLLYIHTLTYAHTTLHLQPLAEGDKQVRCPARATSIPTFFFFYSLFLISLHQSVQNHCNIQTHADRICHSERCSNLAAGKLQKLSQILTEGKKTQAWAGCLQCQREREREREGKESYSSAFLIGLLWQPIGGQAALTAANQKKGPAMSVLLQPKTMTVGTDDSVSMVLWWRLKGTHADIQIHARTHRHTHLGINISINLSNLLTDIAGLSCHNKNPIRTINFNIKICSSLSETSKWSRNSCAGGMGSNLGEGQPYWKGDIAEELIVYYTTSQRCSRCAAKALLQMCTDIRTDDWKTCSVVKRGEHRGRGARTLSASSSLV